MNDQPMNSMDDLHRHCATLPPGPVADIPTLERLLVAAWDALASGDDGGMAGYKLANRMEAIAWNTPILSFQIERHGGVVMGSTRAEIQRWQVDVETKTATLVKSGRRQLRPMATRVNTNPLVEEILDAIRTGTRDKRLVWNGDDKVRVMTCDIFPAGSAVRMTLDGRRRRFREGVANMLLAEGWEQGGNDSFRRTRHKESTSQ